MDSRGWTTHVKPQDCVIDPYHVPDILDLKRGWMGINNAHAILRMHNLF